MILRIFSDSAEMDAVTIIAGIEKNILRIRRYAIQGARENRLVFTETNQISGKLLAQRKAGFLHPSNQSVLQFFDFVGGQCARWISPCGAYRHRLFIRL